mgnify:CR=1 FL=1
MIRYNIITAATAQTFFGCIFAIIASLSIDSWHPPSGYETHYGFFEETTWQVSHIHPTICPTQTNSFRLGLVCYI